MGADKSMSLTESVMPSRGRVGNSSNGEQGKLRNWPGGVGIVVGGQRGTAPKFLQGANVVPILQQA